MAHILADRVRETTTSTGTGALTLGGAVSGFRSFSSAMAVTDTCDYVVSMGSSWEVGVGTLSSTNVLTRTTVMASSSGGGAVNFPSGLKDVALGISASKLASLVALPAQLTTQLTSGTSTPWFDGVR